MMFHVKRFIFLGLLFFPMVLIAQNFSTSTIEVKPMPLLPGNDVKISAFIASRSQNISLSDEAMEWYYWTNFSRSKPKVFWDSVVAPVLNTFPNLKSSYTNSLKRDLYKVASLEMLMPNSKLTAVAQMHASDLGKRKSTPSHTSPSGLTFQERMIKGGIGQCAGENISFGPSNTVLGLIFLFIDEGLPDLGHRKALLSPTYREMGIGIAIYPNGNKLIIKDFSCLQ
ncbi:MAG: CAP domain-containing protein [Flavitalea sp.]